MRITPKLIAQRSMANLQANMDASAHTQQALSSGKQLNVPSDSPTGASQVLRLRGEIRAAQQFERNASDGVSVLSAQDSTLVGMSATTIRIRDLTVQGMNGGALSAEARTAIAKELVQLRDSLLGDANQTLGGRPIFGGATGEKNAYDRSTGGFIGDLTTQVTRRISDTNVVRVDLPGPQAFGPAGGNDLFAIVDRIANDVIANPSNLGADLDDLDTAMKTLQNAMADVGARSARIADGQTAAADRVISLKSGLSEVEDVDLPQAIMNQQAQQVAYQAALGATAKLIQPSLLDYLR
ncbi:MAG: flagellar hook-associated protein FlgL [Propionicimonas sp.]